MKINLNIEDLTPDERKLLYMCNVHHVFDSRALFSDATEYYRQPSQPEPGDEVTIRLRTGKYNVDKAFLYVNNEEYQMYRANSDEQFDFYEYRITVSEHKLYYYFKVTSAKAIYYYNQAGPSRERNQYYDFQIMPGFKTPDWAKGAVMYQIFVDRFCDGDPKNNVVDHEYSYIKGHVYSVKDWDKYPDVFGVREFYGGDLQGVWDKLDYLCDLGVDVIYFNPLFVSPSNHKYDIQDYDYIDPHFGVIVSDQGELLADNDQDNAHATKYINRVTNRLNLEASNQFFAQFIEEVHRRGMKVIIDGVFNHCGSLNKWMDKEHIYSHSEQHYETGAYESANSPYHSFFKFYGDQWPDNNTYDSWWGMETLPKLNYEETDKLEKYILDIAKKWISEPYKVDGWRLDVAADLGYNPEYNHNFWRKFRKVIKDTNPNALIIAEHYGDSYDWLQGDQWDTVMNYDAFMEPVTWFLTGMQKHSDEFRQDMLGNADAFFSAMTHGMARMGGQCYTLSMNELSNHDHSRFLTRTNRTVGRVAPSGSEAANQGINKAVFMEAVVIQMTWPGAPTIYYGDEAGVCGWTDPDNRRTYPWGHEDKLLVDFHRSMIRLHKQSRALREGSYKPLYQQHNVIAYGRFTPEDKVIVIINNNDHEQRIRIPAWEIGLTDHDDVEQLIVTYENGFSTDRLGYSLPNGCLDIGLRKTSAVVLSKIKW